MRRANADNMPAVKRVSRRLFDKCAFVAVTTRDLARARKFWVDRMGFPVVQQKRGDFFMIDAAGVRLCFDLADGETHRLGSFDPVIGLKVESLERALAGLARRGVRPTRAPVATAGGRYAELKDPDGRTVVLTEAD